MKISFILPVYNVEKYIERCLSSIFEQDVSEDDFEVVIVNDCTLDNTMSIIENWRILHKNIRLVEHDKNKGLGAARNTGLKIAKYDYIWFIDTDDYIEKNCLKEIIVLLKAYTPEVLSFNFFKQDKYYTYYRDNLNPPNNIDLMLGSSYLEMYFQPATMSSCSKIFELSYWRKNNFEFSEGVFWEDADLVIKSIYYARRFSYITNHLYYYCYNHNSISRGNSGKKIADMLRMSKRKYDFSRQIDNQKVSNLISQDAIWNTKAVKKILYINNKERNIYYNELKTIDLSILKCQIKNVINRTLLSDSNLIKCILYVISPVLINLKSVKR